MTSFPRPLAALSLLTDTPLALIGLFVDENRNVRYVAITAQGRTVLCDSHKVQVVDGLTMQALAVAEAVLANDGKQPA